MKYQLISVATGMSRWNCSSKNWIKSCLISNSQSGKNFITCSITKVTQSSRTNNLRIWWRFGRPFQQTTSTTIMSLMRMKSRHSSGYLTERSLLKRRFREKQKSWMKTNQGRLIGSSGLPTYARQDKIRPKTTTTSNLEKCMKKLISKEMDSSIKPNLLSF